MATITLSLDTRSSKNGMQHVRIRISHKGTNCFIGTKVYVEPQYFQDGILYDPIHRKAQAAIDKRDRITEQVRCIEDYLAEVDREELAHMTANDIRDHAGMCTQKNVRVHSIRITARPSADKDFLRWFYQYGESRHTKKTRESYEYGSKVLREYCQSLHLFTLTFDDIDYARLSDFAQWLTSTGRGPSTRHMLEAYVRAAYKDAQRRHMVSREHDPYLDYSIKPVPARDIEVLTRNEIHALMTTAFGKKGLQCARDLALASFYLCGANLLDIYEMQKAKRGDVEFVRHKVETRYQKKIQIRIQPELQGIIERYKGDEHLLHFKTTYANYDTFRHKISHRLEEVSKELGFDVTMAKIRRTWATLAAEIECPDAVIDMCMGHVAKTVNSRFYVKPNWERAAKWNRKVIDYVLAA